MSRSDFAVGGGGGGSCRCDPPGCSSWGSGRRCTSLVGFAGSTSPDVVSVLG